MEPTGKYGMGGGCRSGSTNQRHHFRSMLSRPGKAALLRYLSCGGREALAHALDLARAVRRRPPQRTARARSTACALVRLLWPSLLQVLASSVRRSVAQLASLAGKAPPCKKRNHVLFWQSCLASTVLIQPSVPPRHPVLFSEEAIADW